MKCDNYYLQAVKKLSPLSMELYDTVEGHCLATKERECCNCNGDTDNCQFYQEKREKKMTTAEMWLEAQKNTKKWFKCDCMFYNKLYGFIDLLTMRPWPRDAFSAYDDFMKLSHWEEYATPIMTRKEAEDKFSIKIVGMK